MFARIASLSAARVAQEAPYGAGVFVVRRGVLHESHCANARSVTGVQRPRRADDPCVSKDIGLFGLRLLAVHHNGSSVAVTRQAHPSICFSGCLIAAGGSELAS
jgi:hypothetical protein